MSEEVFNEFKSKILSIDPVAFAEKYLTLDGEPFRLHGNGYKPFADIYRYIGAKAVQKNSKPVILVKGRQVGATTMASVLESYFMASGLFGNNGRPPMRLIHCFPNLIHVFTYSKTKLSSLLNTSMMVPDPNKPGKMKPFMLSKLDSTSPANDSQQFKQFEGGNFLRIESTGLAADRLRGGTVDCLLYDECFPYEQNIVIKNGKLPIGKLYDMYVSGHELPEVLTFNEETESFEYKKILKAWKRDPRKLIEIHLENRVIKCTPNHKFLTNNGWKRADELQENNLIKSTYPDICQLSYCLNDDQYQILLGSFLGDGHIANHGKNKYRIREQHGEKQKNYCEWKAKMFNAECKVLHNNGYSRKDANCFSTKIFSLDKEFPKTKTHCPQWVLDDLDARGLAVWFMDDGTTNKYLGGVLNTCSFNEDSHIRIVKKLKSMGIDCEYRFCKMKGKRYPGYYSVFFKKEGYNNLCKLIMPYIHENIYYKVINSSKEKCNYTWDNNFKSYGLVSVKRIIDKNKEDYVYDIEVEDNHNFIATSCRRSKNTGGIIAHNCQDIPREALSNANKLLVQSKYGPPGDGIQVYFGTPKQRGSEYFKMWQASSQQYYHLGCEKCHEHFPLYTPGSNEWEKIWIYGFIVKCPHCGHEQDKRQAAERGRWVASQSEEDSKFVGYHINQFYMPNFTREKIDSEKPENHPINTERAYQNEVLGEFYSGVGFLLTPDEIQNKCGDMGRKMKSRINPGDKIKVYAGFDWGDKLESEDNNGKGKSYSCCIVLAENQPGILDIEFATILKNNNLDFKKQTVDEVFRRYSVELGVGDIGYANDLSELLQKEHGDKFLVSRASGNVRNHIKYDGDVFPKTIHFERDYHIAEVIDLLKRGLIRFPYGNFEQISWLITHCCSMEIKTSTDRWGEISTRYVKGATPNDGFMALVNAYLAYKYSISEGFSLSKKSLLDKDKNNKILAITGFVPRMH